MASKHHFQHTPNRKQNQSWGLEARMADTRVPPRQTKGVIFEPRCRRKRHSGKWFWRAGGQWCTGVKQANREDIKTCMSTRKCCAALSGAESVGGNANRRVYAEDEYTHNYPHHGRLPSPSARASLRQLLFHLILVMLSLPQAEKKHLVTLEAVLLGMTLVLAHNPQSLHQLAKKYVLLILQRLVSGAKVHSAVKPLRGWHRFTCIHPLVGDHPEET